MGLGVGCKANETIGFPTFGEFLDQAAPARTAAAFTSSPAAVVNTYSPVDRFTSFPKTAARLFSINAIMHA